MNVMLAVLLALLLGQADSATSPTPKPQPTSTAPVYFGMPATHFRIESRPLGIDADGNARWLLIARFLDADNKPTRIMANDDTTWTAPRGYLQWQTRMRYGQPAAILKTTSDGPLSASLRVAAPQLGSQTVHADTRNWTGQRVVAAALGPHLVQIGWFPQERNLVRIIRLNADGNGRTAEVIAGPSSTYRDTEVLPNHRYRYIVYRADAPTIKLGPIRTPASLPATRIANASGTAMWLFFTSNPTDAIYYKNLDPKAIVEQAVKAHLHYVELRTAYGAYWELTPQVRPTIDAIIDGLAAHGIGTIGWTVPRDSMYEDLLASTRTAAYRTAKGTPFTGLAIDVERGDEFMGGDPNGLSGLWLYMQRLREAVGSQYLLVSTIEDPYLEHLDNRKYPYAQIARYSSVLQPMAYWRMMRRKPTDPTQVKILLRASYDRVLREAGRRLPISIGGQTTAEGRNGYPPADEITTSLDTAKQIGAIGECFFDWDGTQPYQWAALERYHW
ncbi:MAG: hypothetical protein M3Y21_11800 [Candidatus Eremiobacteraeota bacterium]|nr:hypothetical protein [Candidatus Eremiobacteraeota bacterium]